jgi:hypothetical protein
MASKVLKISVLLMFWSVSGFKVCWSIQRSEVSAALSDAISSPAISNILPEEEFVLTDKSETQKQKIESSKSAELSEVEIQGSSTNGDLSEGEAVLEDESETQEAQEIESSESAELSEVEIQGSSICISEVESVLKGKEKEEFLKFFKGYCHTFFKDKKNEEFLKFFKGYCDTLIKILKEHNGNMVQIVKSVNDAPSSINTTCNVGQDDSLMGKITLGAGQVLLLGTLSVGSYCLLGKLLSSLWKRVKGV